MKSCLSAQDATTTLALPAGGADEEAGVAMNPTDAIAAGDVRQPPLSRASLRALLTEPKPPCISLLMPTHRRPPDNAVDRATFAGLVDVLCDQLAANGHRHDRERLTAPLRALEHDPDFWEHTLDGLAMFVQDGEAVLFRVASPLPQRVMLGERFCTTPLIPLVTAIDQFDLLALTSCIARIYTGTAENLEPVNLEPTLHGVAHVAGELHRVDVIDEDTDEPHRVRASSGVDRTRHGGFGSRHEDVDADTERFFREVDRTILEQVSQASRRPLFVVALAEHAAVFRHISKNTLLEGTVPRDPSRLTAVELARLVQPLLATARQQRVERLLVTYAKALEKGHASGDPAEIARKVMAGGVATLLVEAGRTEAGAFDPLTGEIGWNGCTVAGHNASQGRTADLFNTLCEEVLLHGGDVVTLSRLLMPNENGMAAIYRF